MIPVSAGSRPDAAARRYTSKLFSGSADLEPQLVLYRIPRCAACFERDETITKMVGDDGQLLRSCPICAAPGGTITDHQIVGAVRTGQPGLLKRLWRVLIR